MRDRRTPSLLIVGGTKAGKTHYGGQLLRRLETKKYPLRIVGAPSDLTPFQEVLGSLAEGRSAPHTPTSFYRESLWDIRHKDRGYELQLVWPDYGGEQIEDIVKKRHITEPWIERIREASGWLFFVRLAIVAVPEDILARPRRRDHMSAESTDLNAQSAETSDLELQQDGTHDAELREVPATLSLSTQAGLVELLQALLFVKQVASTSRLRNPKLVLVLSCMDELGLDLSNSAQTPADILRGRLPLVSQFIQSNWDPDCAEVIGLSALGKALDSNISDEAFKEEGPERQGWCLKTQGGLSDDLTLPVLTLMEKIRCDQ